MSCSYSKEEQFDGGSIITDAMKTCLDMKQLWQIDCFCIEKDACIGRRYACFWDPAIIGLEKNPEMKDLYLLFRQDMLKCLELKLNFVDKCEQEALNLGLKRCEERLNNDVK